MTKEEITKLIQASYDQGAKDAQQETLAALEQIVAAARADEREACAKAMQPMLRDMISRGQAVEIIRARGNA
jgi:DNA-binding GntR family transcriptional regulator